VKLNIDYTHEAYDSDNISIDAVDYLRFCAEQGYTESTTLLAQAAEEDLLINEYLLKSAPLIQNYLNEDLSNTASILGWGQTLVSVDNVHLRSNE
jgi:hypothetical protein